MFYIYKEKKYFDILKMYCFNLSWNKGSGFNSRCVPIFLQAKVAQDTYMPIIVDVLETKW